MYVYKLTYHILSIQNYYIRGGAGGKGRGRQRREVWYKYRHVYICDNIYTIHTYIGILYVYTYICTQIYVHVDIDIAYFSYFVGEGGTTRPVIINDRRYKLQMGGGRQLLSPLSATGLVLGLDPGREKGGGAEAFPMHYIYVFTYIYIFIQMQIQIQIQIQSVSCIVLCTMWFRSVYSKVYRI